MLLLLFLLIAEYRAARNSLVFLFGRSSSDESLPGSSGRPLLL
jgi:hypothetical protein